MRTPAPPTTPGTRTGPATALAPEVPRHLARELVRALEDLSRAQRETANRISRALDCPRAGLGVLRLLDRCGPVPMGDVAARLRVDLSVASRQVSHLVDAGLVRRTVDDDDRRTRTVALTAAGRTMAERSYRLSEELADEAFTTWSPDDLADAISAVRRVTESVVAQHDRGT